VTTGTIAIEGECRKSESIKSLETLFVKGPVSPKNCLPDDFVESDLPMTTDCVAVGTAIAGRPRTDPYTKNYLIWLLPISRLTGEVLSVGLFHCQLQSGLSRRFRVSRGLYRTRFVSHTFLCYRVRSHLAKAICTSTHCMTLTV